MTTPGIIMARFIEAAATESFLPAVRVGGATGFWPAFIYDEEDRKGWDDQAWLDNADRWKGRASIGAVSRHAECMEWTADLVGTTERRQIVWAWAFCRANNWDFRKRCARNGWKRPTAYRRLASSFETIAEHFRMRGVLVRLPDNKWLRHETHSMASTDCTLANSDRPAAIPFKPAFRTEPHRDLIQTDEDAEQFATFLADHNRRNEGRREAILEREAKRRAKLGLDAA